MQRLQRNANFHFKRKVFHLIWKAINSQLPSIFSWHAFSKYSRFFSTLLTSIFGFSFRYITLFFALPFFMFADVIKYLLNAFEFLLASSAVSYCIYFLLRRDKRLLEPVVFSKFPFPINNPLNLIFTAIKPFDNFVIVPVNNFPA